jgi:hypothetical protein
MRLRLVNNEYGFIEVERPGIEAMICMRPGRIMRAAIAAQAR